MKISFTAIGLVLSIVVSAQKVDWFKIHRYKVAYLSEEVQETSGLTLMDDKLYTLNDGDNPSEIFELDKTTGQIINRISIPFQNFDWEAIASDGNNWYIGEFGNNWGIRKDLKIYKIPKDSLKNTEIISFHYPEQTQFNKKPHQHNYDAESLVYHNGNLHLFTKEWESYQTTHYQITPTVNDDSQPAKKMEQYALGYLATDAAYFEGQLYIIGYTKKLEVYLTIFQEDDNGLFFNGKPRKYYLGSTSSLGQIEGIAVNEKGIYISGEKFRFKIFNAQPTLYFIPKEQFQ